VLPTRLTDDPASAHAITLTQDPRTDGMPARADLTTVLIAAMEQPPARGRTFALFKETGEPLRDSNVLFGGLILDDADRVRQGSHARSSTPGNEPTQSGEEHTPDDDT
jgi:hypothetical protein